MARWQRILFWSVGIALWVYLGIRAYLIPLIHDETVTYFLYFQSGNFIPPNAYWDANNHLLNSALGSFFNNFGFTSPFLVRFGSWISFLPFLFFTEKIGTRFKEGVAKMLFFVPLLFTPFFIEFFSLSRGYGMAMAWFLGAIYFGTETLKSNQKRNWIGFIFTSILATLSSLSVIVVVLILITWVCGVHFYRQGLSKKLTINGLILYVSQLPMVWYVFQLKERGLLYYGGPDFIDFTLKPMARYYLTGKEHWWVIALVIGLVFISFIGDNAKQLKQTLWNSKNVFGILFISSFGTMFFLNWVLNVNYPEDRAALYLFPLFCGTIASLNHRKLQLAFMLILLWFPVDFVRSANFQYSRLWPNEHVPYSFWNQVKPRTDEYPKTMSAYFLRHGIWSYQSLGKSYSSSPQDLDYPSKWAEVIMVDSTRLDQVDLMNYQVLNFDSISGQTLLQRNKGFIETNYKDTSFTDLQILPENLYTTVMEFDGADLSGQAIAMYGDLEVNTTDLMHLQLIVTLFDSVDTPVYYTKYDFGVVNEEWSSRNKWKLKMFTPPFTPESGRFVAYLYNPHQESHFFKKFHFKMVTLKDN